MDFNKLYNSADKALYYVKQNGKNAYHFFGDKLQKEKERGAKNVDLNYLREVMNRGDGGKGVYSIDFESFHHVYHFISRFIERSKTDVQILLFTVVESSVQDLDVTEVEIEANENTTLKELDKFIRDIWVECCGHLSMFTCNDEQYESCPDTDGFWGEPSKNMNFRLKDVAEVGDTMIYEYDFGSTTELVIKIQSCREGEKRNNEIVILSRNNPLEVVCGKCGKNKAQWVNPEAYYYDENPFWCEECLDNDSDEDVDEDSELDFLLPICNSPRMGVCEYEGSSVYPDQFEPDKE